MKIVNYALNFLLANIDESTEDDLQMSQEEIEQKIKEALGLSYGR
tara:strand:+ start:586 stop:720 length:135 start_codon:yes stop_codon:yes gene_type:complete